MTDLSMGANTALPAPTGDVVIRHADDASVDVNLTAFLVTGSGKVRSDADMVFFNQPAGENGCVTYHPPQKSGGQVEHKLSFDVGRLPQGVEKVVVALTEDRGPGFAKVPGLSAEVVAGGTPVRFTPVPAFTNEKGVMVAEIYLRNGAHKVRANWQGFANGLAGLATMHGVDVDDAPAPPPPAAPTPAAAPTPPPAPTVSFEKVSGAVSMKKGDKPVLMEKTKLITCSVSWSSDTDYDVFAIVYTKDGKQIPVATFGAWGDKPITDWGNGAVKHKGDIKAGSGKGVIRGMAKETTETEVLEIRMNPDILAIVPVAYSAQSNGSGSFHKYKVSTTIDNGSGTVVTVSADNANDDDAVYTCVPGVIYNDADGVRVEPLELYSAKNSERRPTLRRESDGTITVIMDSGAVNDYK